MAEYRKQVVSTPETEVVAKAETADFRELGLTGLNMSIGQVTEEFLPRLKGKELLKTMTEMKDNDPICGAILFAVHMLVRAVEWRGTPADLESEEALRWATFLDECLLDMSSGWEDVLTQVLSMLPYGHSVHEIVYKRRNGDSDDPEQRSKYDDGLIGWRKLPIRGQDTIDRWVLDDQGGIRGIVQMSPPDYRERPIPIEKLLLFRTATYKNNPEGRSILRNAYRPWYFKSKIENIEGIGIERDLAGLPVGWVPPEWLDVNAAPEQKATVAAIHNIVKNLKRDQIEGVLFPLQYDQNGNKMVDLTLMSTGGKRQFDTDSIIGRYDQRIALTVLADFILLGHEKVGSFNLGVTKVDLFSAALGAWLDAIAEVMNLHAIPRLMKLNGVPPELWPTLQHADVQRIDLEVLGTFIERIARAGAPLFPDDRLENQLRLLANLPEIEEGRDEEREAQQALVPVPVDDEDTGVPAPQLQGADGKVSQ